MDNSQTFTVPNQPAMGTTIEAAQGKSSKVLMIVIISIVVALLITVGAYYYLSTQAKAQQVAQQAQEDIKGYSTELNTLDSGDLDSEFSQVDQDLKGL